MINVRLVTHKLKRRDYAYVEAEKLTAGSYKVRKEVQKAFQDSSGFQ